MNFKTKVALLWIFQLSLGLCQNAYKMHNNPRQLGVYSNVFAHLYVILGEGTGRHGKNAEGNLFYLFLGTFNLLFKKGFLISLEIDHVTGWLACEVLGTHMSLPPFSPLLDCRHAPSHAAFTAEPRSSCLPGFSSYPTPAE